MLEKNSSDTIFSEEENGQIEIPVITRDISVQRVYDYVWHTK